MNLLIRQPCLGAGSLAELQPQLRGGDRLVPGLEEHHPPSHARTPGGYRTPAPG